jgi:hypothetical protein
MSTNTLIKRVRQLGDALLGRGEHAVTVPPMDGPLKPNNALENAPHLVDCPEPDNLVELDGAVYFSSLNKLCLLDPAARTARALCAFDAPVTALAAMPGQAILAALANGELRQVSPASGAHAPLATLAGAQGRCITALLPLDHDSVLLTCGSSDNPASQWKRDLMSKAAGGSLIRLDLPTGRLEVLCAGLAWPNGLAALADGSVVISESWRHRLSRCAGGRRTDSLLDDLPGYPSRLAPARGGGFWMSVFAPRSQLVEFVLREEKYKRRMLAEVPEQYWIAPALASGSDFREPLQQGGVKAMGILKPWAPTRSYGMVVKLDGALKPILSLHSRADGRRHGINSVVETDFGLIVASKGGNAILALPDSFA